MHAIHPNALVEQKDPSLDLLQLPFQIQVRRSYHKVATIVEEMPASPNSALGMATTAARDGFRVTIAAVVLIWMMGGGGREGGGGVGGGGGAASTAGEVLFTSTACQQCTLLSRRKACCSPQSMDPGVISFSKALHNLFAI